MHDGSYDVVSANEVPFGVSMTKKCLGAKTPKKQILGAGIGVLSQVSIIFTQTVSDASSGD